MSNQLTTLLHQDEEVLRAQAGGIRRETLQTAVLGHVHLIVNAVFSEFSFQKQRLTKHGSLAIVLLAQLFFVTLRRPSPSQLSCTTSIMCQREAVTTALSSESRGNSEANVAHLLRRHLLATIMVAPSGVGPTPQLNGNDGAGAGLVRVLRR